MTPLRARLFTKPGCHLCEQAQADLDRLRARHPHTLELVDITGDAELMRRYGERIPVLALGDRELDAPLSYPLLERSLRAARATRRTSR